MNSTKRNVPPLWLEQLQLDELSPQRRSALIAEFGAAALAAAAEQRRQQDAVLSAQLPPLRAQQRLWLTGPQRPSTWSKWNPLPLAALGAALLAVFTWVPRSQAPEALPAEHSETRIKGQEPQLLIFRKVATEVQMLDDQASVTAGDVLQVAYVAAGARHGVVASLDGRGAVTIHFPAQSEDTTLQPGKVLLDHAYQLDDAPYYEQFIFITAEQPIDVRAIRSALQADGSAQPTPEGRPAPLPSFSPDHHVFTRLLLKQGAP